MLQYFSKKRHRYFRQRYYERYVERYQNLDAYLSLYRHCVNNMKLTTDVEIGFASNLPFGCHLQDVKNFLAPLAFHETDNEETHCRQLFYKKTIGGYKTRLALHFHEEALFLFSYDFSTLPENDKEKIMDII